MDFRSAIGRLPVPPTFTARSSATYLVMPQLYHADGIHCPMPLIAPFEPEHRCPFGETLQAPLAERDEARRILVGEFAHDAGNHDAVGLGFAAQAEGQLHGRAEEIVVVRHGHRARVGEGSCELRGAIRNRSIRAMSACAPYRALAWSAALSPS